MPAYIFIFFFFNDTATTEIYTLSLHDALPISFALIAEPRVNADSGWVAKQKKRLGRRYESYWYTTVKGEWTKRSEEHTSELQSRLHLVCRLLLEKKKRYPPNFRACH